MALPDLDDLVDYYVNLIIIQYHNQPNARATIDLFVRELLSSDIFFQIQDGYNLTSNQLLWEDNTPLLWSDITPLIWSDTPTAPGAVGMQLDVLGKYAGVDRFYRQLNLIDFFGLTFYSEIDPDSEPKFGFSDYTTYDLDNHNGTLTYNSVLTANNRLVDEAFRTIILVKIFQNNSNHSHASIENGMQALFAGAIWPETSGNMHMFYFVLDNPTPIISAAIAKKILPRPMGVGLLIVENITGLMFGMSDYTGYETPYEYGFSDYAGYDSLPGQVLVYDQISQG